MGDRKHAQQLFNQGVTSANDRSKPEYLTHAFNMFTSSLYADPTWATAAYYTGNSVSDLGFTPAALACWRRALECEMPDVNDNALMDASRAKVYTNLGWRLECAGETDEALSYCNKAVRLDPDLVFAHLNLSIVLARLGRLEEAVASARRAFELAPNDATVEMGLAFALLFNRNLAEGFKHLEARWAYKLHNFSHYPYPKWLGEKGKTLFLVSDQGLGDTLSMTRFLRETCRRSQYVHAAVHPELLKILQHALCDIHNLNLLPQPCNFPAADAWTTFVSLPWALGLSDDEIRAAPPIKIEKQRGNPTQWKVPDRKIHIGIAWRGSALNEINEARSIPLQHFLELYRVPGVQLYGLQVDQNKQQLNDQGCAPVIRDLSGYIGSVADTMTLLQDLDLVVTCESALGHICALSGVETWLPYSWMGRDYRIGFDGSDQIWSKHRIFPQGNDCRWEPVFKNIVEALRERSKTIGR